MNPSFSTKSIDALRRLAGHLKKYGELLLNNGITKFEDLAKKMRVNRPIKGSKALSSKNIASACATDFDTILPFL